MWGYFQCIKVLDFGLPDQSKKCEWGRKISKDKDGVELRRTKILSLILAIVYLMTAIPVFAMEEEIPEIEESEIVENETISEEVDADEETEPEGNGVVV